MARILLIPIGSAGDVHPFVALGMALRERGHPVTVITSAYFESLVRKTGLEFVGLGSIEQFESILLHPDGWHPRRGFRVIFEWGVLPWIRPLYDLIAERYVPGETIVVAALMAFGAGRRRRSSACRWCRSNCSPRCCAAFTTRQFSRGCRSPTGCPRD